MGACRKCEGRLGVQNPGDVCRSCELLAGVKRLADWQSDQHNPEHLGLSKWLRVGDTVDEAFRSYFLETVPPVYWTATLIQMGEPYDHGGRDGAARYATLERFENGWRYIGNRELGEHWPRTPDRVGASTRIRWVEDP